MTKRRKVDPAFRPLGIKVDQLDQATRGMREADIVAFVKLSRADCLAGGDVIETISRKLRDVGRQLYIEVQKRGWV